LKKGEPYPLPPLNSESVKVRKADAQHNVGNSQIEHPWFEAIIDPVDDEINHDKQCPADDLANPVYTLFRHAKEGKPFTGLPTKLHNNGLKQVWFVGNRLMCG
jgi:hypothetical protein